MKKKRHITKGLATFFHYTKRANERYGLDDVHGVEQKICVEIRNKTDNVKKVEKDIYLVRLQKKQYTVVYTKNRGIITFLPPGCHGTFVKPKGSLVQPDIDLRQFKIEPQKKLIKVPPEPFFTDAERKESRDLRDILFAAKREIDLKSIKQGISLIEQVLLTSISQKIRNISDKLHEDMLLRSAKQNDKLRTTNQNA